MKSVMGAAYDQVIFFPRAPNSDRFMEFISVVDVMLHPFPFDGSKTAADAMAMGLPTVTWPSVSTLHLSWFLLLMIDTLNHASIVFGY